jgi:hypothetical protein
LNLAEVFDIDEQIILRWCEIDQWADATNLCNAQKLQLFDAIRKIPGVSVGHVIIGGSNVGKKSVDFLPFLEVYVAFRGLVFRSSENVARFQATYRAGEGWHFIPGGEVQL